MLVQTEKPKIIYLIVYKDGAFNTRSAKPSSKHFQKGTRFFECDSDITLDQLNTLQFFAFNIIRSNLADKVRKLTS